MEKNATACLGIKELVNKVDILNVSGEVSNVLVEVEFLIEHLQEDYFRKQGSLTK